MHRWWSVPKTFRLFDVVAWDNVRQGVGDSIGCIVLAVPPEEAALRLIPEGSSLMVWRPLAQNRMRYREVRDHESYLILTRRPDGAPVAGRFKGLQLLWPKVATLRLATDDVCRHHQAALDMIMPVLRSIAAPGELLDRIRSVSAL